MKTEIKTQFIKRLKSFGWRIAMMFAAFIVTFAINNLASFNLSGEVAVVAGLILGEVSKFLNTKIAESGQELG